MAKKKAAPKAEPSVPTEPGFYWAKFDNDKVEPEVVHVYGDAAGLVAKTSQGISMLEHLLWLSGKLECPTG